VDLMISNHRLINKMMHIQAIKSAGPGPALFLSQFDEQINAHPSLQTHWHWTCSFPSKIYASGAHALDLIITSHLS